MRPAPRSNRAFTRTSRSAVAMALLLIAAVCTAAALVISAAPASADTQPSQEKKSLELVPAPPAGLRDKLAEPRYIGAGSCAARACHGSPTLTPGREWNSAYAVWATSDPHSQAYAVLYTPESHRMASILGVGDAWKAQRCLACHSAPLAGSLANNAVGDTATIMADGVSCEVCHGPAEKYLAAHTMRGWDQLGGARYEKKFGMKNTADIAGRAQVCVGCHVGQPAADGTPWRDVNHDLIAAGHPRLNFDYAAYIATLPPHWNTKKDPQKFEELHSWLIGQFAASEQALKVLEARAKSAQSQSESQSLATDGSQTHSQIVTPAWPEFAEFDCFACHHGLSGASWRQDINQTAANPHDNRPARKPGTPAWGTWYYSTPRLLAGASAVIPESQSANLRQCLNELTKSMQSPLPDAARVAQNADAAASQLEACRQSALAHLPQQPNSSAAAKLRRDIIQSLATQFREHKPESWDEFVQYYLSIVALYKSEIDAQDAPAGQPQNKPSQNKQLLDLLETIRNRLSFSGDLQVNTAEATSGGIQKLSPILCVLRSGFDRPFEFDPYAKQPSSDAGDTAGKNLYELFDKLFDLLTSDSATS